MTPVILKGTSFKGAALYVLHDPDQAKTSDRVAWTLTRNLGTDDPDLAWRVMAATSMSQAKLKQAAGVKNTGRKSADHVMHMILNWHPEERKGLTQEEMIRAANGALRAIKADDRQALIAAHSDGNQPHIHIVLNRVSHEDGRLLPSKYERLRLSKWAQKYEEQRGKIYCEERVTNNAARDRGEYVRGQARVPRHIYELQAANQNNPNFEQIKKEQTQLDARLSKETRARESRRAKAWAELYQARKKSLRAIQDQKQRDQAKAEQKVRDDFKDRWRALHRNQRHDLAGFDRREKTLIGKLNNIVKGVDLKAVFQGDDRKQAISDAYSQIASAGKRREHFVAKQKTAQHRLEQEQKATEKARRQEIHRQSQQKMAERRSLFLAERSTLIFKHDMEDAKNRHEWKKRNDERRAAYEKTRNRESASARHDAAKHKAAVNDNRQDVTTDAIRRAAQRVKDRADQIEKDRSKNQNPDRGPKR